MKRTIWGLGVVILVLFCANTLLADFVCVPAAAFKGWNEEEDFNIWYGQGIYLSKDSTNGPVYAELDLPDGAIIKSMRILYIDNSTSSMEARLMRTNLFNGDMDILFSATSTGESTSMGSAVDSSCSPASSYRKVYNNACSYCIRVYFNDFGTDLKLFGVTVEYE